jgi:hypothetical protein
MPRLPKTVIIHGKKVSDLSPKHGRPHASLWTVTRAICRFWKGNLHDWNEHYDMHPLVQTGKFAGIPERRPDAWRWYLQQDGTRPIYLQAPEAHAPAYRARALALFNQVPGARRFPIREIQKALPINGEPNRWFVEQAGMMIAKACVEDYQVLILNGIGCVNTLEFERAHRSILYWIAFARGQGRQVLIEGPSIFHTPREIYAYEKFNYDELENARAEVKRYAERDDLIAKQEINDREQRRGRPRRFNIPPLEDNPDV